MRGLILEVERIELLSSRCARPRGAGSQYQFGQRHSGSSKRMAATQDFKHDGHTSTSNPIKIEFGLLSRVAGKKPNFGNIIESDDADVLRHPKTGLMQRAQETE